MRRLHEFLAAFALFAVGAWAHAQAVTPQVLAERDAKARDYFTDTVLKAHTGRTLKFYSDAMKGKVVLINFVYTQCSEACPLITAKLMQVQKDLGPAFGDEVRFLSISIDPVSDTPAALSAFARKMGVSHPEWLFLTGEKRNVDHVVAKLGAYSEEVPNHFTGIIIGSPQQARWKKVRPDAPPQAIVVELRALAEAEAEIRKTAGASGARLSRN